MNGIMRDIKAMLRWLDRTEARAENAMTEEGQARYLRWKRLLLVLGVQYHWKWLVIPLSILRWTKHPRTGQKGGAK